MSNQGQQLFEMFAELQLDVIREQGSIPKNCKNIWTVLHSLTNQDCLDIMHYLADLQDKDPTLFQRQHNYTLAEAATLLVKHKQGPRILDTKPYKELYWRFAMTIREVYLEQAKTQHKERLFSV